MNDLAYLYIILISLSFTDEFLTDGTLCAEPLSNLLFVVNERERKYHYTLYVQSGLCNLTNVSLKKLMFKSATIPGGWVILSP